jgi:hypothetical protein
LRNFPRMSFDWLMRWKVFIVVKFMIYFAKSKHILLLIKCSKCMYFFSLNLISFGWLTNRKDNSLIYLQLHITQAN